MVTIKDVAKECNCSVSTVSRALSGSPLIPDVSKKRIVAAAKKMGYVVNIMAKNLKTRTTKNVGILSFVDEKLGFSHFLFSGILDSFVKEMNAFDYDILLISKNTLEDAADLLGYCRGHNLVGVLVFCGDMRGKGITELIKSDIPVAVIDGFSGELPDAAYFISSNNGRIMFDLTESVLIKGHRDVVYVCGENYYVTHERLRGFTSALNKYNIPVTDETIVHGNYYNLSSTEKIICDILKRPKLPTCIFMPDDYCAVKAYDIFANRNIKIGTDISLVGFDGLEIGKHMQPQLTTVEQDVKSIGKLSADTIMNAIAKRQSPPMQLVDARVICGGSVRDLTSKERNVNLQ